MTQRDIAAIYLLTVARSDVAAEQAANYHGALGCLEHIPAQGAGEQDVSECGGLWSVDGAMEWFAFCATPLQIVMILGGACLAVASLADGIYRVARFIRERKEREG